MLSAFCGRIFDWFCIQPSILGKHKEKFMMSKASLSILPILVLAVLLVPSVQAKDMKGFGATLYFSDGSTSKFISVTSDPGYNAAKNRDLLEVHLKGEKLKVPVSDIQEMTIVKPGFDSHSYTKTGKR